MSYRTRSNTNLQTTPIPPDPLRQIHQRLIWALSAASVALIINTVVVVALV
jgi:hypothetical protein